MRRTVRIRLDIPVKELLPTFQAYTAAYNFVCAKGWEDKDFNGVSLHHKTYFETRERFHLPASLAVSARMRATETLATLRKRIKAGKPVSQPHSKFCPVRARSADWGINLDKKEIALLVLSGRKRISAKFHSRFLGHLVDWRRTSAELSIRNGKVYLDISFEKPAPTFKMTGKVVGIDRGLRNIAVSSDNRFFSGKEIRKTAAKHRRLRASLQKKGTKSAKRHLRRLSGRENRFRRNWNHIVVNKILNRLEPGTIISLENLSSIRQRGNRGRRFNRELHSWSFFQLEWILRYKAEAQGILVELVDARYTSQKCSFCGHTEKENRNGGRFHCRKCGFQLDADLNAARNIRANCLDSHRESRRAAANQPIVSDL